MKSFSFLIILHVYLLSMASKSIGVLESSDPFIEKQIQLGEQDLQKNAAESIVSSQPNKFKKKILKLHLQLDQYICCLNFIERNQHIYHILTDDNFPKENIKILRERVIEAEKIDKFDYIQLTSDQNTVLSKQTKSAIVRNYKSAIKQEIQKGNKIIQQATGMKFYEKMYEQLTRDIQAFNSFLNAYQKNQTIDL